MRQLILFLFAGCMACWTSIEAQQVPISNFQSIQSGWMNPGHFPEQNESEFFLSHLQRDVQFDEFNSMADFLHLQSGWRGKSEVFSFGLHLTHDQEHTQNRLGLSPTISARVWRGHHAWASVGIAVGITNWSSNFLGRRIGNREDPLLLARNNFLELDAGLGGQYHVKTDHFELNVEAFATQLPGNLLSSDVNGLHILPHLQAKSSFLFQANENTLIGPLLSHRNVINQGFSYQVGLTDLGVKAEFEKQKFWFAGLYKAGGTGVSGAWGIRVLAVDSVMQPDRAPLQLDVQMAGYYPLEMSPVFGPSVELGLALSLGKPAEATLDTLQDAALFWNGEENLTKHKVKYLDPNGPENLGGKTDQDRKYVYLSYFFPDNDLSFTGQYPNFRGEALRKVGLEWTGVDALLENLLTEVIYQAMHPDTHLVRDPENLEPLKAVSTIELTGLIRDKDFGCHMSSGQIYEGQLGFNNPTDDSLFMAVVFDEMDTVLAFTASASLTNLELASLKLYAMRAKLEYELEKHLGEDFDILREGETIDMEFFKPPIFIKTPRIISENVHQKSFQINMIDLKFSRFKAYWEEEDTGLEPEEWEVQREDYWKNPKRRKRMKR